MRKWSWITIRSWRRRTADESVLENLRIEKDSVRTDVYRILLWDNFNRKYRKAELLLRHGEDGYRIDGILSLPDRYTRDPD